MILKVLLIVILAFIVQFAFNTLLALDVHKRVYNHRPGKCRKIEGPVHGSEDIAIVDELQIAFISSGVFAPVPDPSVITWQGEIFAYDLTKRTYKADIVPIVGLPDRDNFRPHGISHWVLSSGNVRLFIVNHSKQLENSIVILDYNKEKRQLEFVKSIEDDNFVSPNDIVATGAESFIISNDSGAQTPIGKIMEAVTGFYKGGLVYYDGKKSKWLLENYEANGVIISRDEKTLFVAHFHHETIGVYQWDHERIEKISEIPTLTGCDNFHIDENDYLWSACHPVLKDVAAHIQQYTEDSVTSPSHVLRFEFSHDLKTAEMVEVFADDGRFTCGGAVATSFDNGKQLLIGTIFRDVTHCDIVAF